VTRVQRRSAGRAACCASSAGRPARAAPQRGGLLDLRFDTLLLGDGVPILTGAHAALAALVRTF